MLRQYVAITTLNGCSPHRDGSAWLLLRFDRERDYELHGTSDERHRSGSHATGPATLRRPLTGRTAVVWDRSAARSIAAQLDEIQNGKVISIEELETIVRKSRNNDLFDQSDPRALAHAFRELAAELAAFDSVTLARAQGFGAQAGWPFADLLADELVSRAASPILTRIESTLGSHEMAFLATRERPDALRRTGDTDPLSADEVAAMFGEGGPFRQVLPAFERRQSQQAMAEAVARNLNADGWLMVEAGTGTGKSLAYLTPAALFALRRGERVVVSTNTKALQDQLISKDVPGVRNALSTAGIQEELNATLLKGRSNYVCLRRWFAHDKQPAASESDAGMRAKVHIWLPLTEQGDRSELQLTADEEAEFDRISAEGEVCNAATCVYQQRNQCFLYRARRQADAAHIVVVNHALLLSDSGAEGSILPSFERLIVDEAHHLEDQATSQFSVTVSELSVAEHADDLAKTDGPALTGLLSEAALLLSRSAIDEQSIERSAQAREKLQLVHPAAQRCRTSSSRLFSLLRGLIDQTGISDTGYGRSLVLSPQVRRSPLWSEVEIAFEDLAETLGELEDLARWYLGALHRQRPESPDFEAVEDPFEDIAIELSAAVDRGLELNANLSEMILSPSGDRVYWLSASAIVNRLSLNVAPLHVGELLRASLLERMRSVVLTSATLTTDDHFGYIKDRLSLHEADELALESPFDYRRSALLYLCDDVPVPNQPGYQRVLEDTIVELGEAIGGRTLVLFTSHAALAATHRAIKERLRREGVTVLAQRADGSPRQLIEQFRSTPQTLLLGTSTFWEGIDVMGEALSALVIAKLPFAVPSDPIVSARSAQFDDPFHQYSVPQAVLRFKQGFGRLIRSSADRGICVVMDHRAISKRYGASFVQSLPPCTVRIGAASEIAAVAQEWLGLGG